MTEKKPTDTQPVGSLWDLGTSKDVQVTRPDGVTVTVSGGAYVLTAPGQYVSGKKAVEAT